jgi:hypothetical protein
VGFGVGVSFMIRLASVTLFDASSRLGSTSCPS